MGCRVETSASYDERFEKALVWRLEWYGRTSALSLLEAQEAAEAMVEAFPLCGAPVEPSDDPAPAWARRWVRVDRYIAVYEYRASEGRAVFLDLFYPGENWR